MKVAVITLGCRTNQAESAKISSFISEHGHYLVDTKDNPDIYIINSCSVTAKADAQSRQLAMKFLKNNKKVVLTGCYAELNKEELLTSLPGVALVGNDRKEDFRSYLPLLGSEANASGGPIRTVSHRKRPIVKVQDGCDNRCAYCIIPLARGASRSRPADEVIAEVRQIEDSGYREIVLSGIHLGMYGKDLPVRSDLSSLLAGILHATRHIRVRLSSLEIPEIDDKLLELMQDSRICNHLHLPLQSGSDAVLSKMKRTYLKAEFEECMNTLQKRVKNIAIGTDIIAGFPGESDDDFLSGIRFIERMGFAYLHVFPYSRRKGTAAADLPLQVADNVKRERVSVLRELGERKRSAFADMQLGQTLDVLVERSDVSGYLGISANFCKVLIHTEERIPSGSLVSARIVGHSHVGLDAHLINAS